MPQALRTLARRHRYLSLEGALQLLWWAAISISCIEDIKPAPYDILLVMMMPVWLFTRFTLNRVQIVFFGLLLARQFLEMFALLPYVTEPDAFQYTYYSTVVFTFAMFAALFLANNTHERVNIFLKAYFISCCITSLAAVVGFLNIGGMAAHFEVEGQRAAGTFNDPNVMGSFCVLGALYGLQVVLRSSPKRAMILFPFLLLICGGILLSFSRGSWGALVVTSMLLGFLTYVTSPDARARRRVALTFAIIVSLAVLLFLVLLLNADFSRFFFERAQLLHSYDTGANGRFGNQMRSLKHLFTLPWGYGPLRFRLFYGLEPHESYIGAFANSGWLAGFVFIALAITTNFVGLRLALKPSPYQRYAQIIWPATLAHFMQGFQIDIDHWPFFSLAMGAVWGLEAARQNWLGRARAAALRAPPHMPLPDARPA
ncbi:MAG: hypothetical protein KGQ37_08280 [Hyphomicrobiales bacterium]|nr:hypothetical protein [Hyphomicrobiales bacterium]